MAERKFKVAIIQMKPKPLDPEHNFSVATDYLRSAASQGASLAILPEYHLSGWEPKDPAFVTIARTANKYQKAYQSLAAELKINICAGTIVQTAPDDPPASNSNSNGTTDPAPNTDSRPLASCTVSAEPESLNGDDTDEASKPTLLNISPFISDTGELLGTYIKTNIWIPERPHLTSSVDYYNSRSNTLQSPTSDSQSQPQPKSLPTHHIHRPHQQADGNSAGIAHDEPYAPPPSQPHQIISTALGKIGILICWDLGFPEAFRSLIHQGAEIILIPTFWGAADLSDEGRALNPDGEKLFLESALVARAFENTCTVVFCNVGGPAEEGFLGLSGVYAPIVGRVKPSFDGPEEGMRIVEVDLGVQEIAERNYRIREDLEGEGWHYGKY